MSATVPRLSSPILIEIIAAVVPFVLVLWLTGGSMFAAYGVLTLFAGLGRAVRYGP
jgi:hypothetical protein